MRHGTLTGYQYHHCRCEPCRAAKRVAAPPTLVRGELAVSCWCEAEIVHAPPSLIIAGKTRSCGRETCKEPA